MAIGSITAVVLVMYLLIGPKSADEQKTVFAGTNYVQINSATWGLNCNQHIDYAIKEAQAERAAAPLEKRKDIQIPEPVARNNVLSHMSELCNGKEVCSFLVESDIIGIDPVYSCYKELQLTYRCYDVDKLRSITFKQGDMLKLDCTPTTPAAN